MRDGPGLLVGGVGPGVGFRKRKRADGLTGCQPPQPLLFLRGTPGVGEQFGHERVMDDQRDGDGGAGPRDRFDGEGVARGSRGRAAPGLRNGHPEQAALRGRTHDVEGKLAALVDCRRARGDDLRRELLDRRLKGPLCGGRLENHTAPRARR